MTLQSTLEDLASKFAQDIIAAMCATPLEELLGEATPARAAAPRKTGRLPRRSEEDIGKVVDRICGLLAKSKDGLRAEALREKLGISAKELPRPLADALNNKKIVKSGQKRATVYRLAGAKKKTASKKKVAPKKKATAPKTKTANGVATP
jgi:hypothetical protein